MSETKTKIELQLPEVRTCKDFPDFIRRVKNAGVIIVRVELSMKNQEKCFILTAYNRTYNEIYRYDYVTMHYQNKVEDMIMVQNLVAVRGGAWTPEYVHFLLNTMKAS